VEQWRIRVNDKYPAYISWPTFEQIQTMLLKGVVFILSTLSGGKPNSLPQRL